MLEKVGELALGKLSELFLDKANEKIKKYKEKKQWEELFVDTNEFLLKKVERGDLLIEEIAILLSSDDMKNLAKSITHESKYQLHDKLHIKLQKIMLQYEIPFNEAEFYISNFINIILHDLEMISPIACQNAFLGEWKKREEKDLSAIKKELSNLSITIIKMQEKSVSVYSLDQMEVEIAAQTHNPTLNLDFFEIDDETFQEQFINSLYQENVYVKGKCKEEIIFCILNELRKINSGKMVLVVKKEQDWQNLKFANEENKELGGKILIPWFYSEQIYSIPNNINIFVFGEDEYCVGKEAIEIRKRKRSTVSNKLVKAGLGHEDAYKLIEDTHGLYIPLKKKLIRGIDNVIPSWVEGEKNIIIPLLLCGKWVENDGDKMVLEELCKMEYEQIMHSINPYLKGENPLFVRFKDHGTTILHLASTENAWDYLDDYVVVGNKIWRKYIEIIQAIVLEENPIFSFPTEKQHYAGLLPGGKTVWSSTLKKGLLRSLIMKAYYKKDMESQSAIDRVVESILNDIKSENQWLSTASLFTILCEASPKAVIHRLNLEWKNETGLKEVFLKEEDTGIFTRNDYTHYIWGIEQLLYQKEYAAWAVRWFIKMHSLCKKFPINNSPDETLKKVFCPWYNVTALEQEEKIVLAKEAFRQGYDVWDLFYEELPWQKLSMVGEPCKPKYKSIEEPRLMTYYEIGLTYREYMKLCLDYMDFDVRRWKKILGIVNHFNNEIFQMVFDKLLYEIQSMNDLEIINIKDEIRHEIYRNRYFEDSEWSMREDMLGQLENIMNEIKTKDEIYEYRYLFLSKYDFPLLHPCPFLEDEKKELNEKLANDEIEDGIKRFKKNKLDVISLVLICSEFENTTLGIYLFDFFSDKTFEGELFSQIIKVGRNERIVLDYVKKAYQISSDILKVAIEIAKKEKVDDVLVGLLMIEVIDATKVPLICKESDQIKKKYWNNSFRGNHIMNKETCHFVINEMKKYSNQLAIIEELDNCGDYFSDEEILDLLLNFNNLEVGNISQLSSYHFKKIMRRLQDLYMFTEKCDIIAGLELIYRGLLETGDMRCFYRCLKRSPKFYNDIIAIIFKNDDGNACEGNELDEKNISNIFSLYYNLNFCPAESEGKVDQEALYIWISEFEEGLKKNKQIRLFTNLLGHVLSASPIGEDGYFPTEAVRNAIEFYGDESLVNKYVISTSNMRGMYSPSGGKGERALANKYKKNAEFLRVKYPKTAKIFDKLYQNYLYEADSERESEEYSGI